MALPAGVLYRPLDAADIPDLVRMLPPLLPGNWSVEALQALLSSSHHCRVLCSADYSDDVLLAFAEFTVVTDESELLNLAVDAEVQGCGLGRATLLAVLDEARTLGCVRCYLEVRRTNDAAIALYSELGFQLEGVRKAYYPPRQPDEQAEDALLYALAL